MANTVTFSRGDTFACSWTWNPGAGEPATLAGTTITSTVKDKCGNEYELTVTKAVDNLSFVTSFSGDTSDWHLGLASWDIRFQFSGSPVTHSQIFRINVQETITKS